MTSFAPLARALSEEGVRCVAAAGRDKDRLFLATHAAALRELLPPDAGDGSGPAL